jgi:hypothetical protein
MLLRRNPSASGTTTICTATYALYLVCLKNFDMSISTNPVGLCTLKDLLSGNQDNI